MIYNNSIKNNSITYLNDNFNQHFLIVLNFKLYKILNIIKILITKKFFISSL